MSTIVVSSTLSREFVGLRGIVSLPLLHDIGEAFTAAFTTSALHDFLRGAFGKQQFRWYCVNTMHSISVITFSDVADPKLLSFRGVVVEIAAPDASPFVLNVQDVDVVKPDKPLRRTKYIHALE